MKLASKFIPAIFTAVILMSACGNENSAVTKADSEKKEDSIITLEAGSICTIEDGDGGYGVVKVLVIEPRVIHIKIYKNKYKERPSKIDLADLSLGSINDTDGFGIGHVPLDRAGFYLKWKPEPVAFQKVEDDELEGYKMWKNQ